MVVISADSATPFGGSLGHAFHQGWNFGGGLQYDVGLGPWLDVSVRYQTIFNIASATVTNAEGVEEEVRPNITANEFTVKVGVIFFIGK